MIVANLATYPLRAESLQSVILTISPQVDEMNVVLNQFENIPIDVDVPDNVNLIIPNSDTKDAGKFLPSVTHADYVLFIDDDILYPRDYVDLTIREFESLGSRRFIGGYHASIYHRPKLRFSLSGLRRFASYWLHPNKIEWYRKVYPFGDALGSPLVVDQIGSGTAIMRGADVPPYSYMSSSMRFVDVRLAKWCFEKNITPVALCRPQGWLGEILFEESIHQSFTGRQPYVATEVREYAFKVKGRGKPPSP